LGDGGGCGGGGIHVCAGIEGWLVLPTDIEVYEYFFELLKLPPPLRKLLGGVADCCLNDDEWTVDGMAFGYGGGGGGGCVRCGMRCCSIW